MPQELHVVRCYACQKFQVQIVKKIPKWQCKVCNEKQSVIKVYAQGSGKDCRQYVQDLNLKQGLLSAQEPASSAEDNCYTFQQIPSYSNNPVHSGDQIGTSKWSEYLDHEDAKECEDDSTCNQNLIDASQKRCQSNKPNPKDNSLKQQKVTKWSNYVQENEPETDWNVDFNLHEIEESSKKGRKRKLPESTDSLNEGEGLSFQGFEATFPDYHDQSSSGYYKNTKLNRFGGEEEDHQTFLKKSKSKWSDYVDSKDDTPTISCTNLKKEKPSKKTLKTSAFPQESYSRKTSDDAELPWKFSPCGDASKYLQKKSASASVSSVNPFCTANDDNLDGILDF